MYVQKGDLEKKVEEVKTWTVSEMSKGVNHFKDFEDKIKGFAGGLKHAHNRIDTRAIQNQAAAKRILALEGHCDVLTGQVRCR